MYNSGWIAERTSALSTPSTITIQAARGRSVRRNLKWSGLPEPVPCDRLEEESQRYRSPFFAAKGSRIWQERSRGFRWERSATEGYRGQRGRHFPYLRANHRE